MRENSLPGATDALHIETYANTTSLTANVVVAVDLMVQSSNSAIQYGINVDRSITNKVALL